jgi:adenine phosphoribosyltransferase
MELSHRDSSQILAQRVKSKIRDIPDFPQPGIIFKDITPVLKDGKLLGDIVREWGEFYRGKVDFIAGIESRGFIFGAPLATYLGIGFVPIRKEGKLPAETCKVRYGLEYGCDVLEIHLDAFSDSPSKRVLVVDDLLATGGTATAGVQLVEIAGGEVVGVQFLVELSFLPGGECLKNAGIPYRALVSY